MRNLTATLIPLLSLALTGLLWVNHTIAGARELDLPATAATDLAADLFTPDVWYYDGVEGSQLGWAVHTAGDVDGDGYADILVGAPLYLVDGERPGTVFLFYGGTFGVSWYGLNDEGVQLAVSEEEMAGSQFGFSVGTAGDVDGDGDDEVLVGAPSYKVAFGDRFPQSGAVFVYYGSPDRSESGLDEATAPFVVAEDPKIALGWAVSAAGDVNGDGFDDVIVSAPQYDDSSSQGKIYLHRGGATGLDPVAAWTYECDPGALCGISLDAAGDVNGDGYDDVIVGAPFWDGGFSDEGRALVFYGCDPEAEQPVCLGGLQPEPAWSLASGQHDAGFGQSVAGAGDVNNDGYDDILVGAPEYTYDEDLPRTGAAFLFLGSEDGPSLFYDWASYGEEEYAYYGDALHSAGDVDADGFADVLVGSKYLDEGGDCDPKTDQGAAYLFTGSSSGLSADPAWVACGDKKEAYFGNSLGSAGDVDGDGSDDVLVGAYHLRLDSEENVWRGRAYAYLTGPEYSVVFLPLVVSP